MASAEKDRVRLQRGTNEKGTSAFGTVKLVPADRDEIGIELMDVFERFLSEPLNGVGVKENAIPATEVSDFSDGLNSPYLIIGGHDRD